MGAVHCSDGQTWAGAGLAAAVFSCRAGEIGASYEEMGLEFSTEQFSTAHTAPVVAGLFPDRPGRAGPGGTAGLLTRSCQLLVVFLGDVVRVLRLHEDCPESSK